MKLTELLTAPWAILPESLREIQEIYVTHLKGEKIDIAAVESRLGRPLANEQQHYTVRDGGVAVMAVEGVIAPKANLFTQISGGVSSQMLVQQLKSMAADSRVKSVIMAIDSPGGSVFGPPEVASAVRALSAEKPIVSMSDGSMSSAAYWIGSAANAVFLSGPTVQAGSVGIYSRMGLSQADPASIEMVRGKYKRGGINGERPSAEYMAYVDGQLDHLYTVFVDTVAQHRGVSSEQALERMADGRVFIGQQAIDAGLVDGFATEDDLAEQLASNPARYSTRRKAVFALGEIPATAAGVLPVGEATQTGPVSLGATPTTEGTTPMTITREQLAAEAPQVLQAILAEGASAERDRIQAVEAQLIPGHEAIISAMKFDGKSSGGDAAMAVNAAERNLRIAQATAAAAEATKPVGAVPSPSITAVLPTAAEQKAAAEAQANQGAQLSIEDSCKAQWDKDAGVRAEFSSLAAFTAFTRATAEGRAKVFKRD